MLCPRQLLLLLLTASTTALRRQRLQPLPCPCLNASEELAAGNASLARQREQSLAAVHGAAAAAEERAGAAVRAMAADSWKKLGAVKAQELQGASAAVQTEGLREAPKVEHILGAIRALGTQDFSPVFARSEEWGRSQALNEYNRTAGPMLKEADQLAHKIEQLRQEARSSADTSAATAAKMVQAAREAEAMSMSLSNAHAASLVDRVGADNNATLGQLQQALQLATAGKALLDEARTLAVSAFSRASVAEVQAAKALGVARNNTRRIALLKARVQAAENSVEAASHTR